MVKHEGLEPSLFWTENPVTQPVSRMLHLNYFEEHTQAYPKALSLIECVHQNSLPSCGFRYRILGTAGRRITFIRTRQGVK